MIVLALAATLAAVAPGMAAGPGTAAAAAPADTATRVPGSWLRLGLSQEQVLARAPSPLAAGPDAHGEATRQGTATWFGILGQVQLQFRDERLVRARFTVEDAAPHMTDYVKDQLRLAGYRARCEQDDPGLMTCDWNGATHVRLELRQRRLEATVTAAELEPAAAPRRILPRPSPARGDTVPVFPQVFVLGRPAPPGAAAVPALVDSTPLLAPPYPPRARAAGVQGRVWVRALVDTNGSVYATEIVRSIPELDSAAVAVARSCRFRAFETEGTPMRFRVEFPVTFRVR